MGNRGWKGERFLRLMKSFNMHLPHTFVWHFDKAYTCMNNGRSEPKQMDYMATTAPHRWITSAKRLECDATQSDHWPLVLSLLRKQPEAGKATYNVAKAGGAAAFFAQGHPPNKDTENRPAWSGVHGELSGILRGTVITNRGSANIRRGASLGAEGLVEQHGGDARGD